jgi:hypothetical protein
VRGNCQRLSLLMKGVSSAAVVAQPEFKKVQRGEEGWERRRAYRAALTEIYGTDDSPNIVHVPLTCPLHRVPTPTTQPVQLGPRSILARDPPAIARPAYPTPPLPALQTLPKTK